MKFIVELNRNGGVWLADWEGDPGRTLVKASAKLFDSYVDAEVALEEARKFRPSLHAKIEMV